MVVYEGRGKAQDSVANTQQQSHHHDLEAQVENSLAGSVQQLGRDIVHIFHKITFFELTPKLEALLIASQSASTLLPPWISLRI